MSKKGLVEAYYSIYNKVEPVHVDLTEELIDEIVDELVEELVEDGYEEDEAYSLVEEATDSYIVEAKVTFGHDTAPRRESGAPVGARRKYGMRKAGEAVKAAKGAAKGAYKTAKAKAAGAAVDVALAGSAAKKKAGEVKQAVKDAPGKAKAAASGAKAKAKSGIKGFIKRQAEKVVKRMGEAVVYGGTPAKKPEPKDTRYTVTAADKKGNTKAYQNYKAGDKRYKAADHLGEEQVDEALTGERYKKVMKKPGGTAYSRKVSADPAKRATRGGKGGESDFGAGDRGAGNKAARRAGTYQEEEYAIDEAKKMKGEDPCWKGYEMVGTKKKGGKEVPNCVPTTKKEELEATGLFSEKEIEAILEAQMLDENRAAARAAGGYKDDSKKQTDPSKAGFTGISGSIKDIMRQNKEIEARNKKK